MSDSLSKLEKRTAYTLVLPAVLLVFAIVLFPIFANVWISFKDIELKDIRIPEPRAKKIVKSISENQSELKIIYKLRNSSLIQEIRNVQFQDKFPTNVSPINLDPRCNFQSKKVVCNFGNWQAKYRENFEITIQNNKGETIDKKTIKSQKPILSGRADNPLLTTNFTLINFKKVFFKNDFKDLLLTTFYFTFFGTLGAIIFGVLAAQLVNQKFSGRTFMRSILLFPYVGPVVALAYTWTLLLDPNSGTLNALLIKFQILDQPINLLGQKYLTFQFLGIDLKLVTLLNLDIDFFKFPSAKTSS